MKIARVMPIHKKGDCHLVNNYRPISILTSFSKILERTVYIRTSQFLEKHKILSDSQFGFREKHSTTHAILQLIDKIRVDRDQSTLYTRWEFSWTSPRLLIPLIIPSFCLNFPFMAFEVLPWSDTGIISLTANNLFVLTAKSPLLNH